MLKHYFLSQSNFKTFIIILFKDFIEFKLFLNYFKVITDFVITIFCYIYKFELV